MNIATIVQASFVNRARFGRYLNHLGLLGISVEIGTHRGDFAKQLLAEWRGQLLYCVDPYLSDYDRTDPASSGERQSDKERAMHHLASDKQGRGRLLSVSSWGASKLDLGLLDFVYVDGCHQPEEVRRDLELWWPKLRVGGVLAGHDFVCPGEKHGGWGQYIQKEVLEFTERHAVKFVYLVLEEDNSPWSYFMMKE